MQSKGKISIGNCDGPVYGQYYVSHWLLWFIFLIKFQENSLKGLNFNT